MKYGSAFRLWLFIVKNANNFSMRPYLAHNDPKMATTAANKSSQLAAKIRLSFAIVGGVTNSYTP